VVCLGCWAVVLVVVVVRAGQGMEGEGRGCLGGRRLAGRRGRIARWMTREAAGVVVLGDELL